MKLETALGILFKELIETINLEDKRLSENCINWKT